MDEFELKNTLFALRERLTNQQQSIRSSALGDGGFRDLGRAPINLAEQASDEQELDLMVGRITASTETLTAIEDAIRRLDAGQFNVCEECGKEIGVRRLGIRPWARLCVDCKRKNEMEEES